MMPSPDEIKDSMLSAQFADWLSRQGAPLPWNFGAIIGEIVDAEERVVFHVDVSYSREKAGQISAAILTSVNTCGGFKACRCAEPTRTARSTPTNAPAASTPRRSDEDA